MPNILCDNPGPTEAVLRRRRGPCTFTQRDVTAAVRAVIKARLEVTGIKIAPDGNILVSVGRGSEPSPGNEWDNV